MPWNPGPEMQTLNPELRTLNFGKCMTWMFRVQRSTFDVRPLSIRYAFFRGSNVFRGSCRSVVNSFPKHSKEGAGVETGDGGLKR